MTAAKETRLGRFTKIFGVFCLGTVRSIRHKSYSREAIEGGLAAKNW